MCGDTSAADSASSYVWPEGQIDEYLQNREELDSLYGQRSVVGGFAIGFYWSSSEYDEFPLAWYDSVYSDLFSVTGKDSVYGVRAVRVF